jgi:hypothetical protein
VESHFNFFSRFIPLLLHHPYSHSSHALCFVILSSVASGNLSALSLCMSDLFAATQSLSEAVSLFLVGAFLITAGIALRLILRAYRGGVAPKPTQGQADIRL